MVAPAQVQSVSHRVSRPNLLEEWCRAWVSTVSGKPEDVIGDVKFEHRQPRRQGFIMSGPELLVGVAAGEKNGDRDFGASSGATVAVRSSLTGSGAD